MALHIIIIVHSAPLLVAMHLISRKVKNIIDNISTRISIIIIIIIIIIILILIIIIIITIRIIVIVIIITTTSFSHRFHIDSCLVYSV